MDEKNEIAQISKQNADKLAEIYRDYDLTKKPIP